MKDNLKTAVFCILILSIIFFVYVKTEERKVNLDYGFLEREVSFDQRKCKDILDNHIYIAIQRAVFKIEFDENFRLNEVKRRHLDKGKVFPQPIEKNVSEGCLENPLQARSFYHDEVGTIRGLNGYHPEQRYENEFNKLLAGKFQPNGSCEIEKTDSRFTICTLRDQRLIEHEVHTVYMADRSQYTTPQGKGFFVYCDHLPLHHCEINYGVDKDFSISANLDIKARPINKAIEDDRKRRLEYTRLLFKNYPWVN